MITIILVCIAAYLIGSLSTGFLIARACGVDDIRAHGSGGSGATNVARVLGVHYFLLIFFLDFFKAYAFLKVCFWYNISDYSLAAVAVSLLLGNGAPIFLKFRGGKGVSTTFGILAALMPCVAGGCIGIWVLVIALTRTSGKASLVSLSIMPLLAWLCGNSLLFILLTLFMTAWGFFLHRTNIVTYLSK
ncbi:MAG: glycerol-3-phosphate acyltransferase [Candidatus Dependentiae bacterium]|nr:glycerol-3-phosphate acyltransferase [Candidatus Dependentiae bacterium]